jgi:D-amino peptidase
MKIYVLTDLEGVAGVARWNQTGADTPGYAQAVRLLSAELQACVAGIQSRDPQADIWVWDAHGPGGLDYELLPKGARLLNNGPAPRDGLLDASFDALFFLGQHAKASTRNGNLAHTYSSEHIASIRINGIELGEFGCRAALAGSLGVRTVFVSGDDCMAREATELVPGIVTAIVKTGLGPQMALHLAPTDARDLVRQKAAEAMAAISQIAPCQPFAAPPDGTDARYRQEVTIWGRTDPPFLLTMGFEQTGAHTFVKEADSLTDLFI